MSKYVFPQRASLRHSGWATGNQNDVKSVNFIFCWQECMTNLQVSHLYRSEVVHVKLSQLVSVTNYLYITSIDIENNCSR